jgi:hypothetical protein
MKRKIVVIHHIVPVGYSEYRLKGILEYILGKSNKVPLEAKTKIRLFYDYFVDFMKYETIDQKYGIIYWFEEDEVFFKKESTGELWATVMEKEVL